MADEQKPDARLAITAELSNGSWVLYAPNGQNRVAIATGSAGTGVMFPVSILDRYATRDEQ